MGGKRWIRQMLVSAFLVPSVVCGTEFFINFIAIYYHASRAIPFGSMVRVFCDIVIPFFHVFTKMCVCVLLMCRWRSRAFVVSLFCPWRSSELFWVAIYRGNQITLAVSMLSHDLSRRRSGLWSLPLSLLLVEFYLLVQFSLKCINQATTKCLTFQALIFEIFAGILSSLRSGPTKSTTSMVSCFLWC